MTTRLSANSARGIHAARFAAELTKAMRVRRVSNLRLAEATGCTKSSIANWKVGCNLPRTDTALRLAEALDWPRLVEISRAGRSRPCARCGRQMVNEGGGQKRYCSVACRDVDEQLRRPTAGAALADAVRAELDKVEGTTRQVARRPLRAALEAYAASDAKRVGRIDKLGAQLQGVMAAVDAMCAGCEPAGLCRNIECALRGVSPLPMASLVEAGEVRAPEGSWSPRFRERTLGRIRAGNATRWSRDGERERMSEVQKARFAAMTDEQRAAFGASISAARRRQAEEKSA